MDINQLFQETMDLPPEPGPLTLENGSEHLVKIAMSKATAKGHGISIKVEFLEGQFKGQEMWDSIYFSGKSTAGARRFNAEKFDKIRNAGVDEATLSSGASLESIAGVLKDKKVNLKVRWQDPEDPDSFGAHTWSPVGGSNGLPGF